MNAAKQLAKAALLGAEAFAADCKCVPAHDKGLMAMIAGREIGEHPDGEAPSTKLYDVWLGAWHAANLALQPPTEPQEDIDPVAMAAEINAHLEDGGAVQMVTYGRSVIYQKRNAGDFVARGKDLYVRRGRSYDCLSCAGRLGVAIRFGRYK
jgi:hypothetical protein